MFIRAPEKDPWIPLPGSWEEAVPTWEEQVDGFYHERKYKRASQQVANPDDKPSKTPEKLPPL